MSPGYGLKTRLFRGNSLLLNKQQEIQFIVLANLFLYHNVFLYYHSPSSSKCLYCQNTVQNVTNVVVTTLLYMNQNKAVESIINSQIERCDRGLR